MKLQTPIRITSLRVDTSEQESQQIAATAMAKVNLVTDPTLSKEQRQVMYELHMPELAAQQPQNGSKREYIGNQAIDFQDSSSGQRQTYTNHKTNGIPGTTAGKRETVNGFILDFV
jgi:hypothetical protein